MRRLQQSPLFRILCFLLALLLLYRAADLFCSVAETFDGVDRNSWLYTDPVFAAMDDRADSVASLFAYRQDLEQLQQREKAGENVAYRKSKVQQEIAALEDQLSASSTCFLWRVSDIYGNRLDTNLEEWDALEDQADLLQDAIFLPEAHYVTHDGNAWYTWSDPSQPIDPDRADGEEPQEESGADGSPYIIEYGLPEQIPNGISDEFSRMAATYQSHRATFYGYLQGFSLHLALALVCLACLLWACGHRAGVEGIVTGWQEKIWLDLYLALDALLFTGGLVAILWLMDLWFDAVRGWYTYDLSFETDTIRFALALLLTLEALLVFLVVRTAVVRIKAGTFLRSFLLARVTVRLWRLCCRTGALVLHLLRGIPFFWRSAVFCGGTFLVLLWLSFGFYRSAATLLLWVLLALAVFLLVCWWSLGFHQLRRGTRAMVAGDLEHHIETRFLLPDLRDHAEDLNNISLGLNSALDEKIRSERFKAELITNVSHDLKTPLTSIISYVNLLKTTQQTDPKALEYIEVLDRKSQRLKKLTEDLVEASKASTGVLRVEREKIGMSQLIDQATAEWSEKLASQRLTLICNLPEGETWVQADGRHLWRVLDNLLSNCSKYALEGTRVYLDLVRGKGQVTLSVKNISREPLNIPPERLMERFVRGEESRSSEGSGLGLSIARSLTELQGGTFDILVDGDLFKAVLTLPQAG